MSTATAQLWDRRHLLSVLVASNLKRQNKSSALGYLWWLVDPLLMMAVYYIVVVVLFRRGGDNDPFLLFLLCGLLPWKAFTASLSQSVSSLKGASSIIKAISFPKAVLPLSLVVSNLIYFGFGLLVAMAAALLYAPSHGTWPTLWYAVLPVLVFIQLLFTAGMALILSTMGLFYVDTGNMLGHVLRMWYFLSPGLYSIERVPEHLRPIFRLNPFSGLMTAYRDVIMHGRMPMAIDLWYPLLIGVLAFAFGWVLFHRNEGRFVQTL